MFIDDNAEPDSPSVQSGAPCADQSTSFAKSQIRHCPPDGVGDVNTWKDNAECPKLQCPRDGVKKKLLRILLYNSEVSYRLRGLRSSV
jgi:hypothetical protein